MVSIRPIHRAIVPVDSAAAARLSAPNYDEFQGDREIWDMLQARPDNVLRITMAHCDVTDFAEHGVEGSDEALRRSAENMRSFVDSALTRIADDVLFIYEVVSPRRPDVRQIGLGGLGKTSEIRTDDNPSGTVIRNEGIMPEKAAGRAKLITATSADFGTVNLAVRDDAGRLLEELERIADSRGHDFEAVDEGDNRHRVWVISDRFERDELTARLGAEPAAYVADGNHRSAAAAQSGQAAFLTVFFPAGRLRLEPYNRLVKSVGVSREALLDKLHTAFAVESLGACAPYRPAEIHDIGLYIGGEWFRLVPRAGTFDPANAAESIDSDIIQRHIFRDILGLHDPQDKKINYVGGNKDAAWLQRQVDAGDYQFALSVAPVPMEQFIAVCEQNRFMPPKSTWFDPKIRSGMVVSLVD
ncbi:MAG: DUF1015 family protein [Planctomycetaceae bacterium]